MIYYSFIHDSIKRFRLDRWSYLIILYLVLRITFGLSYWLIYGFIAFMILIRIKIEVMLMLFFGMTLVAYVLGQETEANHYMSFVYGFMVLMLCIHLYQGTILRHKKNI